MKIDAKCSFISCTKCGTHFQVTKDLVVEHEDEHGEITYTTEKILDDEKTAELTEAHFKAGCEKRVWSWDEIEYLADEEEV